MTESDANIPVRVVCFDLGGVLVRIRRTFNEAILASGVPLREAQDLADAEARAEREALISAHQRGQIDFATYVRQFAEAVLGLYSAEEVARIHQAVLIDEYPGVAQFLRSLRANLSLRLACLSNTDDAHWLRLTATGPNAEFPSLGLLHQRLASHVLRLAKPDPLIYAAARRHFGCEPEKIVFFDDLPRNVKAAEAAGWHAHLIDHTQDPVAQMRTLLAGYHLVG
jgi:glucose-1-phosphatase